MEKNFDQAEFRELLKKCIGTRTQKQFAEETGTTPETICRMLNDSICPKPRKKTVESFVGHSRGVSMAEMMECCGYTADTPEEKAGNLKSDIEDFFGFSDGEHDIYASEKDFSEKLKTFLDRPQLSVITRGFPDNGRVRITWGYDGHTYLTQFSLECSAAEGGTAVTGADLQSAGKLTEYDVEDRAGKELLETIFGGPHIHQTYTAGPGFEVSGVPQGFHAFLDSHSATFCTDAAKAKVYRKAVRTGEYEKLMADFYKKNKGYEQIMTDTTAVLHVIAEIMAEETGLDFVYMCADSHVPERQRNACILAAGGPDAEKQPEEYRKLMAYLYICASQLGIDRFGTVVHNETRYVPGYIYVTKDTYLC